MVGLEPHAQTNYYQITALPLFVLMGTVVAASGISKDLYEAVRKWIGHVRGGLAMATVGGCGLFAAICGDSIATAVTMGKIAHPEMKRYNYDDRLSSGAIAAGGTIGILIPPSLGFILYALLTEQSVGHLFIAGIIPGILEVLFYMGAIFIVCRINPRMGPPGPRVSLEKRSRVIHNLAHGAYFSVDHGGIYGGVFTPTEAGAIGAFGAFVVGFAFSRLKWPGVKCDHRDGQQYGHDPYLLVGAYIFMRFTAVSNLPAYLSDLIIGIQLPPIFIIIGLLLVYVILGSFLDVLIVIILTTPIVFPTILALGYDPIWWGVIMVRIMEIGMVTPPYGINLFVLAKTINVPLGTVYRGVAPFVLADLLHISLLVAVPEISLFLVKTMF